MKKNNSIEFIECESCDSKPGSPVLCNSCLSNRNAISTLKTLHRRYANERAKELVGTLGVGDYSLLPRLEELKYFYENGAFAKLKKVEVFVNLDKDSLKWTAIVKMRGSNPVLKGVRMKAHKFFNSKGIYLMMLNYRDTIVSPDKSECFVYFDISDTELSMATIMARSDKYVKMNKLSVWRPQ
jgi:hypothetical protein